MAQLNILGLDHMGRSYDKTYATLSRVKPSVITLELSLHGYDGEVYLGKLFDDSLEMLATREKFLKRSIRGGEFQAGYIFARRNGLPLYVIDKTIVPPEEVVKYNIMAMENPHDAFPYGKIPEELFEQWDYKVRNEFMAQVLDLLAEMYPRGNTSHVGGADHIRQDNAEGAIPIQNLVRKFDRVIPHDI